jgi:lysine-specific permease
MGSVMTELSQKLQARHVNMIALGGSIGTGIFLASGYAIAIGGPGGALLAYILMAIVVYFLMTSLGEMSTYKPSSGTFCEYSNLYVGKSFGFAMGYNYWLNWAITIAAEISAAAIIMKFWFPEINGAIFSIIIFIAIFIFNIFSVRVYGEVEYGLSLMKVTVIILFIILGLIALGHKPHFGGDNWHIVGAPFHNGFLGFLTVFLFAGFSFQGSELVGVAAGETHEPKKNIPRSIKRVFWRLCLFYILSIGIISLLIPYTDPRLLNQDNVSMSPYTLIFQIYLSHYAASFINLVILVAVLSAANASMYSSTRIMWYLAKTKQAPKKFAQLNSMSVPFYALLITALIGSLVFISSYVGNGVLFSYLVQISSLSGFIAWFGIALSHYKFRKNYLPQHGGLNSLIYKAKFYPWAQILSMIFIIFIISAQFVTLNSTGNTFWSLIMVYSSVILYFLLYFGHKLFARK